VAGGQQTALPPGSVDEPIRLGQRTRQRLLDQHGASPFHERDRHVHMRLRRHRDGDGVHQRLDVSRSCEGPDAVPGGNLLRTARPGVHDADEFDARHIREQPGMVLAEVANADDGNTQACH
jgi:hypothetical protein